jgi:pimeloyl-ACP methyl ester carboxylesterase
MLAARIEKRVDLFHHGRIRRGHGGKPEHVNVNCVSRRESQHNSERTQPTASTVHPEHLAAIDAEVAIGATEVLHLPPRLTVREPQHEESRDVSGHDQESDDPQGSVGVNRREIVHRLNVTRPFAARKRLGSRKPIGRRAERRLTPRNARKGAVTDKRFQVILLPGGVLPAELAYPALLAACGDDVDGRPKELEMYATDAPLPNYTLQNEIDGINRFADEAGFERFHLVGYSAGGASSLAYCAAHPERLLSLALNEPAWAGRAYLPDEARVWDRFREISSLPPSEMMREFVLAQLKPGVDPPPPPASDDPPPWMAKRPPGVKKFLEIFLESDLDLDGLGGFKGPVLFTLGGKSNPAYFPREAERLAKVFDDLTVEVFPERHHFDPPHRVEPEKMARSLRALWERASV